MRDIFDIDLDLNDMKTYGPLARFAECMFGDHSVDGLTLKDVVSRNPDLILVEEMILYLDYTLRHPKGCLWATAKKGWLESHFDNYCCEIEGHTSILLVLMDYQDYVASITFLDELEQFDGGTK